MPISNALRGIAFLLLQVMTLIIPSACEQRVFNDGSIRTAVENGDYAGIEDWNVIQVTDMSELFEFATDFNSDISQWDTSEVTNMSYMFYSASAFNVDVGGWVTSKVEDMSYMFAHASAFDKDVSGWVTSKVEDMRYMFYYATSFQQTFCWHLDDVEHKDYMFHESPGAIDCPPTRRVF